jgi:hypothetical protein
MPRTGTVALVFESRIRRSNCITAQEMPATKVLREVQIIVHFCILQASIVSHSIPVVMAQPVK